MTLDERTCPICGCPFQPKAVNSLTCSPVCSKKAERLRDAVRQFNAGKRDLRPKTLEQAMRLLEADEVIAAAKAEQAQRKAEAEQAEQEAQDAAEHAAELEAERRWNAMISEHMQACRDRMKTKGWGPLTLSTTAPEARRKFTVKLPERTPPHDTLRI
ncbi:hypothetical protein [Celeribacter sp. ULVN23_4]